VLGNMKDASAMDPSIDLQTILDKHAKYLRGETDGLRADLRGANLGGANLSGANLGGANLMGTKGILRELHVDLLMLLDQPGLIRAYKLVNNYNQGPYMGTITYEIGATVAVDDADPDPTEDCGAGINVATLSWCLREWQPGYRILIVEFTAADIACIPHATDGKFRLHRCKVIGEKVIDYGALGLEP